MAALESLASGVPVVAWDTPVYRQIIRDSESGFLVPYAEVIRKMLREAEKK